MNILVTGDDGIFAEGLWALVKELRKYFVVIVVAPDRKQNAVGTAATVDRPIRVQKVNFFVPKVETWSVEGTPGDCVFLAIHKLVKDEISLVVSGINEGPNRGIDIFSSGTVAAAIKAYLFGLPALAISQDLGKNSNLDTAARLATLLAKTIDSKLLPPTVCLNVNVPNLALHEIKGIRTARLAGGGIYSDSVEEDSGRHGDKDHGVKDRYWLVRKREKMVPGINTDIWAGQHGYISITPLDPFGNKRLASISGKLCCELFDGLKQ
jgi:5'-nucleotidase